MGNMSTGEKIGATILAILYFPFMLIKNALTGIGVIKEQTEFEYDPSKDPNHPDYKGE